MTIKELFDSQIKILAGAGISSGNSDLMYLFCHILKVDPSYIFSHTENEIDLGQQLEIDDAVGKLAGHEPVQYIIGTQEFMGFSFRVNEQVLIPRPETELLVEEIVKWSDQKIDPIKMLDLGTGSGAIAVSLACLIGNAHVIAVDISPEALAVAKQNAADNNVSDHITFIEGDMLSPNLYSSITDEFGLFDIIASNPPYIPSAEIAGLDASVKDFEPVTALDGGLDGLDFYHAIATYAKPMLKENGLLIAEAGFDTTDKVFDIFKLSFHSVKIIKDYSSIPRLVICSD
jgi:release factor glutamine methyltransferase